MPHQLDALDLNLMRLLKAVVENRSIKLAAWSRIPRYMADWRVIGFLFIHEEMGVTLAS